jgi:CRP-like cAMP-binding protein
MTGRSDVLALTEGMDERRLAPGDVLFDQGGGTGSGVAVLVDGALDVELGGALITEITIPGAFVGEIGALLGTARTATVSARAPTTVRMIGDPDAFFADHPQLALELARQLAARLQRLLAYLADTRAQYADSGADGQLTVIHAALGRIASRPAIDVEPGSERSDYD